MKHFHKISSDNNFDKINPLTELGTFATQVLSDDQCLIQT